MKLLGEVVYQTDGLISVLANAYAFYGGAHPNTSTLTWSFDLTTGEFLTLDALNAQSSTDSALGKTLVDTLASEIVNRIYEEGLDDYLYDDFYSYVYDLSSNAHFYFSGSGMTVNFDAYVLGPYASGPQTLEIPYSRVYNALDSHTQSLLNVPQDEIIIADYYTTKTLWSWFNMTTPPVDSGAPGITVDGLPLARVTLGDVNTLDELRALLCEHVEPRSLPTNGSPAAALPSSTMRSMCSAPTAAATSPSTPRAIWSRGTAIAASSFRRSPAGRGTMPAGNLRPRPRNRDIQLPRSPQ